MKKQTVSLILGSGGARGLAHIGVIKQLCEAGFDIRSIAGTSMGALIGGIYAMDKLDVYTDWVTALERRDVIGLLDLSWGRNGLIKGDRIIAVLKELVGDVNIEDLPLRYTAVATDIENEEEVWLDSGSLFDAIRASISIPTIFTPFHHQQHYFLDGSLINPIPIAPTLNDDTDLTIAISLCGKTEVKIQPVEQLPTDNSQRSDYHQQIIDFVADMKAKLGVRSEEIPGMFDVIVKSMSIMEYTIAQWQLQAYSPDITIEIPRNAGNFYEFHRACELIAIGQQKTKQALADYQF